MRLQPVVLRGRVATEIISFAARARAELVCAGTHGHTVLDRLPLGSVTTELVSAAHGSVLVTPPVRV